MSEKTAYGITVTSVESIDGNSSISFHRMKTGTLLLICGGLLLICHVAIVVLYPLCNWLVDGGSPSLMAYLNWIDRIAYLFIVPIYFINATLLFVHCRKNNDEHVVKQKKLAKWWGTGLLIMGIYPLLLFFRQLIRLYFGNEIQIKYGLLDEIQNVVELSLCLVIILLICYAAAKEINNRHFQKLMLWNLAACAVFVLTFMPFDMAEMDAQHMPSLGKYMIFTIIRQDKSSLFIAVNLLIMGVWLRKSSQQENLSQHEDECMNEQEENL